MLVAVCHNCDQVFVQDVTIIVIIVFHKTTRVSRLLVYLYCNPIFKLLHAIKRLVYQFQASPLPAFGSHFWKMWTRHMYPSWPLGSRRGRVLLRVLQRRYRRFFETGKPRFFDFHDYFLWKSLYLRAMDRFVEYLDVQGHFQPFLSLLSHFSTILYF